MRQGVYESYVRNNEVKLQLVNTFLYGIHSLCFPFVLAVLVHYMIVARWGYVKVLIFINMDLENQKFINNSCDYSFSFNMNHCSLTAQQLSVNSYNKMVWTYHNIHNNKTIIAICCKPINFICTDFILQKSLFCDISIQENIYVACLSSFCVWVYFRRFSSLM